jgi:hypothetical protein
MKVSNNTPFVLIYNCLSFLPNLARSSYPFIFFAKKIDKFKAILKVYYILNDIAIKIILL